MGFELIASVIIGTDYTGNCKSYYHMITIMMNPGQKFIEGQHTYIYNFGEGGGYIYIVV